MAYWITCLIPTCKNTCGRSNTKTTFLEIFLIGYHFISARKVSSALFRLLPPASLLVGHDRLNAIVMGGFE